MFTTVVPAAEGPGARLEASPARSRRYTGSDVGEVEADRADPGQREEGERDSRSCRTRPGSRSAARRTTTPITALNGTRSRLTRRNIHQPGIARSREKAYQVREALVRPAVTQKIWPTVAIRITSFAAHESIALVEIEKTAPPPSLTASTSLAANRKASSTNQPISAEKKTERQSPGRRPWPRHGSPRRYVPRRRSRSACTSSAGIRSAAPGTRSRGRRRAAVEAVVVDSLAEDEAEALVVVGDEDQQPDDHRDAQHVPADRDVVEQGQDPVGEDVEDRVERRDQEEEEQVSPRICTSSAKLTPKMSTP